MANEIAGGGRARAVAVGGLLLTLLLAALDGTIVTTAMPRILAELGGLDRYTWVTTAYLLASTVAVPVAGKLSDLRGRRPLLLTGVAWFVVASALCAAAADIGQLIAARALQGVGGGIVTAAVFAAVPELFSPASRARLVGLFTGTYAVASGLGALLGGILTDAFGWRSVFAVNLPLGLVAAALLLLTYPARPALARGRVDYAGAATLVGGVGALLFAVSVGGRELAWTSPGLLALVVVGVAFLVLFARVEARASEPIIPLGLLRSRSVGLPTLGMALMSIGLFALTLFVPLFVQGVSGRSAAGGGSALVPMMASFVAGSVVVGQLIARVGRYRFAGVGGLALAALGFALLTSLEPTSSGAELVRTLALTGFGLGGALAAFAVANQSAVPLHLVGVSTSLGSFARSVGSTFGSAGLGAVLAAGIGDASSSLPPPELLAPALRGVFFTAMVVALVGAALALLIVEAPLRSRAPRPSSAPVPAPAAVAAD
jgi:EmrB/QacA subfamily drug resistance transporter